MSWMRSWRRTVACSCARVAKKTGRPLAVIDGAKVEALARIHCTTAEIAAVLGCSPDTLERRFAALLKKGREEGRASLRRSQWKLANEGNATMCIWLGKQLLGQKDRHEIGGDPEAPLQAALTVKFVKASEA